MKQTVTETMFIEAFAKAGRSDQFSVDARQALYAYYSDLESDTGEEVELDVVAICCEWGEYTLDELRQDYPDQIEGVEDLDKAAEILADETTVIPVDDETILVMTF
jgi:hypothetical protein